MSNRQRICFAIFANLAMKFATPRSRDKVSADSSLRLSIAATVAFADGSMLAAEQRREFIRGRLLIERIADKDRTTLANIERIRELCRVDARGPGHSLDQL